MPSSIRNSAQADQRPEKGTNDGKAMSYIGPPYLSPFICVEQECGCT